MSDSSSLAIKAPRSSNIELLRILAMFIIVLHHYCVNSGLLSVLNLSHPDFNTVWVQFASIGGKIGVNIFFIITGYFMSRSKLQLKKIWQFAFQIFSTSVIVWIFLTIQGMHYDIMNYASLVPFLSGLPVSFIGTYLVLYILSDVINTAFDALSRVQMNLLLIVLLIYFSVAPLIPLVGETWHYLGWGFTMYMLGAYIRRFDIGSLNLPYGMITLGLVVVTWGAIYLFDIVNARYHINSVSWMFFMSDANRLNIFLIAVSIFMLFLRWQLPYNKVVNKMGGGDLRRSAVACYRHTNAPMAVA